MPCDPVGIRTRDPQLRRLLLYPAELPDLARVSALSTCFVHEITHAGTQNRAYKGNLDAKVLLFFDLCKYFCKNL